MKFAVIVFPGSNCDHDAYHAAKHVSGQDAEFVWHKETSLNGADAVILPGGFSHGDYLRTGAIARFSPIMAAVADFARRGGPVLGICNGFQVLLEAGLLPGAMLRNRDLKFHCEHIWVRGRADRHAVHPSGGPRPGAADSDRAWRGQLLRRAGSNPGLESSGRIVFRYCDATGRVTDAANPNGSLNNIAGICNESRNVVGPDAAPRTACETVLGSADGRVMFESVISALTGETACGARNDT